MQDETARPAAGAGGSDAAQTQSAVRRPERRARRSWFFWPLFLLLAAAEPFFLAMDPLGVTTATNTVSNAIANRVAAPLYGYAPEEPDAQYVALSTRSVAVVLIDDRALDTLNVVYPLDYFYQLEMFSRILQFKPRAVFVDLLYSYDRGGLGDMAQLLKEEADHQGAPMVFASANGTVPWAAAETSPAISERFRTAAARVLLDEPVYPLWHEVYIGGAAETEGARPKVPGVALTMLQTACAETGSWGARAGQAGCRDLDSLESAVRADRPPLALRYGSLSQEAWQPQGDLVGFRGEAFAAKAKALDDGCRHFPPDGEGRYQEALARFLGSLRPFRKGETPLACAYTLTIPLEQLMDASDQSNRYLQEALANKIVFVGTAIVGAHDRVPILDAHGPGVYAHAMATDNLLLFGEDYLRPPPNFGLNKILDLSAIGLGEFDLQQDSMLEVATSVIIMLSAALIAPRAARWMRAGNPKLRGFAVSLLWILIITLVTALALWFVTTALRWPAHNWVGAIFYAFGSRRLLLALAEKEFAGGAADS